MDIVEGQVESLKELKRILRQNGITGFNSISDIKKFIRTYDSERNAIPKIIEDGFEKKLHDLESDYIKLQRDLDNLKETLSTELRNIIENLRDKLNQITEKRNSHIFYKILLYPKLKTTALHRSSLEKNFEIIIQRKTSHTEQEVVQSKSRLEKHIKNKESFLSEWSIQRYKKIDFAKKVVDGLYTLIAGAIGEHSVVKELEKLSDSHFIFNDFSVEFDPPIFNRKENDKIFSIQIDHLLICNSGIFILETKNWSKKSIASLDLRSPVNQIRRTSFALFVMLNSEPEYNAVKLVQHHWGKKLIPVKNIIVMIHEKPKEKFKHVKVVTLNELVGYISYFDPIFNDSEVKRIADALRARSVGDFCEPDREFYFGLSDSMDILDSS